MKTVDFSESILVIDLKGSRSRYLNRRYVTSGKSFHVKLTPQTCTYIVKMRFEGVKKKINNACYYVIQKS